MHQVRVEVKWANLTINLKDVKEHTTQDLRKKHFGTANTEDKSLRQERASRAGASRSMSLEQHGRQGNRLGQWE